jgi:hypothetical protein
MASADADNNPEEKPKGCELTIVLTADEFAEFRLAAEDESTVDFLKRIALNSVKSGRKVIHANGPMLTPI